MVKPSMLPASSRPGFSRGFTLIELMIAIAILGILLGIAVPTYSKYIREARRAEAQSEMLQIRLGLEKWRANQNTYSSNLADAGFTDNNDYYNYTITGASGSAYTINATAVVGKSQVNDKTGSGTSCTPMTLNQSGTKTPAGCWKK
jgi:type IV pilus assembly protein PilE